MSLERDVKWMLWSPSPGESKIVKMTEKADQILPHKNTPQRSLGAKIFQGVVTGLGVAELIHQGAVFAKTGKLDPSMGADTLREKITEITGIQPSSDVIPGNKADIPTQIPTQTPKTIDIPGHGPVTQATPFDVPTQLETPTAEPTNEPTNVPEPTFEPMKQLIENPMGKTPCTWDDVSSGRLADNVKKVLQPFDSNAVNNGWKNQTNGSNSRLMLSPTDSNIMQLGAICKIDDKFENLNGMKSYVVSVGIKNIDGSVGILNFFANDEDYLSGFLSLFNSSNGKNIAIVRALNPSQIVEHQNDRYAPMFRLYAVEGMPVITAINKLQTTGIVSNEVSRVLLIYASAN